MAVAHRYADGGRVYRDIAFIYGPGHEIFVPTAAFSLVEKSLAGYRKFLWFLEPLGALVAAALTFWLIRFKFLSLLLLFPFLYWGQIHIRMALPLAAAFLFLAALRSVNPIRARLLCASSGALCVAAYFYSMESGPLLVAAVLTFCLVRALRSWRQREALRILGDQAVSFLGGLAAVGIPIVVWLGATGRLELLIENTVALPRFMYGIYQKPAPDLTSALIRFFANPFRIFYGNEVWIRWWLPPFLYVAALLIALSKKERSWRGDVTILLSVAGLFFFSIPLGRSDFDHWMKGTAFYWVLLVWLADSNLGIALAPGKRILKLAGFGGLLLVTGLVLRQGRFIYLKENILNPQRPPQIEKTLRPPALERLGSIHIGTSEAGLLQGTVERIWKRVPPGTPVYIFSHDSMYYFLADVKNPTRHASAMKVIGKRRVEEVIETLKAGPPRLILAAMADGAISFYPSQEPIVNFIESRYRKAEDFNGFGFFVPKE